MVHRTHRGSVKHRIPLLALIFCAVMLMLAVSATGRAAASEALTESSGEPAEKIEDPFGRESPRAMQIGLFNVLGSGDEADLAPYVEGADPASETSLRQLRAFAAALDNSGELIPRLGLPIAPEGSLTDGLDPDLEEIGSLSLESGTVPILARRIETDAGTAIWQVSAETIDQVPLDNLSAAVDDAVEPGRGDIMLLGAPLSAWLFLVGLGLALFTAIVLGFKLIIRRLGLDDQRHAHPVAAILLAAFPPIALMGVYLVLERLAMPLGAGLVERTAIERYSDIAMGFAAVWLAWRLAGVVNHLLNRWLRQTDKPAWIGLSNFVTRLFRLALVVVAVATFLATFAIDVTTGLAALGIGGIALALGARKAVEDIVGSVMILADKPVRIGDRCRIGGIEGDVVDIGMRSTRIQTLSRTVLTIPNNVFASESIENLALRDRYFVEQRFLLPYDTAPDKIERILTAARELLEEQASYIPTVCPVRFEGFTPSGFEIHIRCHLKAETYVQGHFVEERFLLALLQRLSGMGVSIVPAAQRVEFAGRPTFMRDAVGVSPDMREGGD